MVPSERIELPTDGLQDSWSTAELTWPKQKYPAKPLRFPYQHAPGAVNRPAVAIERPSSCPRSGDVSVERPTLGDLFFKFLRRQFGPIRLARHSPRTKLFACYLVLCFELLLVDLR